MKRLAFLILLLFMLFQGLSSLATLEAETGKVTELFRYFETSTSRFELGTKLNKGDDIEEIAPHKFKVIKSFGGARGIYIFTDPNGIISRFLFEYGKEGTLAQRQKIYEQMLGAPTSQNLEGSNKFISWKDLDTEFRLLENENGDIMSEMIDLKQ